MEALVLVLLVCVCGILLREDVWNFPGVKETHTERGLGLRRRWMWWAGEAMVEAAHSGGQGGTDGDEWDWRGWKVSRWWQAFPAGLGSFVLP